MAMNNQYTPKEKQKQFYPEYLNWRSIIKRANCKQSTYYGIHVHEAWLDFFQFLADVGAKPTSEHTIDRIDNEKGYTPNNVRWATKSEQQLNRRIPKNNKTGIKGVTIRKGKYRATFRRKDIGLYDTIKEAELAYNEARQSHIKNEKEKHGRKRKV
jgi:predicted transcriptional regulator